LDLTISQFTILDEREIKLLVQQFKRNELKKIDREKQVLINKLEKEREKQQRDYNRQLMDLIKAHNEQMKEFLLLLTNPKPTLLIQNSNIAGIVSAGDVSIG
jgi:hypothetical protein